MQYIIIYPFILISRLQGFTRLNKLEVCLSHKSTINYSSIMGEDFDADVKMWMNNPQDKHLIKIVGDNLDLILQRRDQRKDNPNTDFHW